MFLQLLVGIVSLPFLKSRCKIPVIFYRDMLMGLRSKGKGIIKIRVKCKPDFGNGFFTHGVYMM
jgi:hypothetical protein